MFKITSKTCLIALLGFGLGTAANSDSMRLSAKSQTPKQTEVVIVGAGLSGLATAYGLQKKNIKYHILELGNRVGGRVRTVEYVRGKEKIFTDSGMEEYWESNPAVKIIKELKLPHSSDVAVSSIVLGGVLHPLGDESPQEYKQKIFSSDELTALKRFQTKVTPLIKGLKPGVLPPEDVLKLKDISFSQYVTDQKLPTKVADWIRVSIECEVGTHWDRISALDGLAEFHIFLGDGEACYRVEGGNDKFTEAFANAIGRKNISLGKRVTRIVTKNNRVTVNYLELETNRNGIIEADHVVSTIPIYRLFEVQMDPPLSQTKWQAIQSMGWGSYFKAHIFLKPGSEKFWTQNGTSALPILSDSDLGVIYEGNDDEGKTRIISLLIHGDTAEAYNLMPLDIVREKITASLEKLWPGVRAAITDVEFYRYHPRAIAAWPVGRSRFDALSNEIRKPENRVYLAGDFTESSHSDGAFISAERVVNQIAEIERLPKASVVEPSTKASQK